MSSTLTAAGLGQSTAVSIGGDAIIGSSYAELMPLFEADGQTQAIVIYTEPGGRMEAELARWVADNDSRLPIVAFMAGRFMDEMPGMTFGHAGTIVEGKEDTEREDRAPVGRGDRCGGGDRRDPGPRQGADRGDRVSVEPGEKHGIFIDVEVSDAARTDTELAKKLEEACPVDIFATADGGVEIVRANLDECVLCELCLTRPPGGGARGEAYDGGAALERASASA